MARMEVYDGGNVKRRQIDEGFVEKGKKTLNDGVFTHRRHTFGISPYLGEKLGASSNSIPLKSRTILRLSCSPPHSLELMIRIICKGDSILLFLIVTRMMNLSCVVMLGGFSQRNRSDMTLQILEDWQDDDLIAEDIRSESPK